MELQRNPEWAADSLAIVITKEYAGNYIKRLHKAGFNLACLGGDPQIKVPRTTRAIIICSSTASHAATGKALAWARQVSGRTAIYADTVSQMLIELKAANILVARKDAHAKMDLPLSFSFNVPPKIDPTDPTIPKFSDAIDLVDWVFTLHDAYRELTLADVMRIVIAQNEIDDHILNIEMDVMDAIILWRTMRGYDVTRQFEDELTDPANWLPAELEPYRSIIESPKGERAAGGRGRRNHQTGWTQQDEQRLRATERVLKPGGFYSLARLRALPRDSRDAAIRMRHGLQYLLYTLQMYRSRNEHYVG